MALPKVHVVEAPRSGYGLQQPLGGFQRLRRRVVQRAEINPVGLQFSDALEFLVR